MAVAFDAGSTGQISGTSSLTISHTVGSGSDRALVVQVMCLGATDYLSGATVTYGGTSMGSPAVTLTGGYCYTWILAAPASGTANIVITPTSAAYLNAVCASFTGVDQATPVARSGEYNNGYATSPRTMSITISSGEMAVDLLYINHGSPTTTPTSPQTRIGSQFTNTGLWTSTGSYQAGSGTVMEWTVTGAGGTFAALQLTTVLAAASGGGGGGSNAPIHLLRTRQIP